jgi:hypothetical protein
MFRLGARRGAVCFVHSRGSYADLSDFHELFADAAASGCSLQLCHLAASCGKKVDLALVLEMMDGLCARAGCDITAEQYPYTAGMTRIESSVFAPGWEDRLGIGPDDLRWAATGKSATRAEIDERRRPGGAGGLVAVHSIPPASTEACLRHPRVMVASDGVPWENGMSHPRSAGCFARVLGEYVRERGVLTLTEAIRKMTLMPARRLEGMCSAMRAKGRVQRGADADLCVFDPRTVRDTATFLRPASKSKGIVHVLVHGTLVVRDAVFQPDALPGRAVRGDLYRLG